ncbi:putative reverse transcriptase zinc-binding domain-containing protein [Helianthus anomalus]
MGSGVVVFNWRWSRPELNLSEQAELQQLENGLAATNLTSGCDRTSWNYDEAGEFRVSSLKEIISTHNRVRPSRVFEWNNWVPKKVAIVAWRAEMERLPTKCALSNRNIALQNRICPLCGNYEETSNHLFVACHFAQIIWQYIADWCKIPPIIAFEFKDLMELHGSGPGSRKKEKSITCYSSSSHLVHLENKK